MTIRERWTTRVAFHPEGWAGRQRHCARRKAEPIETYIALFRGINVGGKNLMPMKRLTVCLESLGLSRVQTYIQSGNVVFGCEKGTPAAWERKIQAAVQDAFGFEPRVLVLAAGELKAAVSANPFPKAASEPKSLHLNVLAAKPKQPDLETLRSLCKVNERFHLDGRMFYTHLPAGVAGSKLAARAEAALGVPATGRNWRTVTKLLAMVEG